jgi:hypothetical protein
MPPIPIGGEPGSKILAGKVVQWRSASLLSGSTSTKMTKAMCGLQLANLAVSICARS